MANKIPLRAPVAQPAPSCPGVTAYRQFGMFAERVTLPCLGHDEYGNHLVRDPYGELHWVSR